MKITVISDIEGYEELRENWDTVYLADPNTTVFLSWVWLRGWIAGTSYKWMVLAAQPPYRSSYVAFMIIGLQHIEKNGKSQVRVHMGGNPFSYHTGFICLPEHVEEAIPAFAFFIKDQLNWNIFHLKNVFNPRLDLFLDYFSQKRFSIEETNRTPCPYITLPESFDQYLNEAIGSHSLRRLKAKVRKIENLNEFRMTHASDDNINSSIETLLGLWQSQWGVQREDALNGFRFLFRTCFENGHLWSRILYSGAVPIAGSMSFIDREKKEFIPSLNVFNSKFYTLSPGSIMLLHSIQYAIENGFRIFDFGVDDKEYKFALGAKERFNRNIIIKNVGYIKNLRSRLKIRTRLRRFMGDFRCERKNTEVGGTGNSIIAHLI